MKVTDHLTPEEKKMVLEYARTGMRLRETARNLFMTHRTLLVCFDSIYKKTLLSPRKFKDLVELVNMLEEDDDSAS